jgi:hypothetical protein
VPDERSATGAGGEADPAPDGAPAARTVWLLYFLGLALQCILWFLLFLAIVVAVASGGHLTEFRYVGF